MTMTPVEPADVVRRLRARGAVGIVALESMGPLTDFGRWSFVSARPERTVRHLPERPDGDGSFPAWLGGLTYERQHWWGWYPSGVVWDRVEGTMQVQGVPHLEWASLLGDDTPLPHPSPLRVGEWSADDIDYRSGVLAVQELIRAGEVYQVNLSRGVSAPADGDPVAAWLRLRELNPSPFMAFADFTHVGGDCVVSCSPERLVTWRDGLVSARPIAGTRRRGDTPAEDARFEAELRSDPKELAEHTMLVDLLRHDIGHVAAPATVHVPAFRVVERYSHVMHLVSSVDAVPAAGIGTADVVDAVFPGGTITGAPKSRVMEAIEEFEPSPRGWYTGSLGIIAGDRVDLNICIRTAQFSPADDGTWRVGVRAGGGTVIDSDPERESAETVHKAQALLSALSGHPGRPPHSCEPPTGGAPWAPPPVSPLSGRPRVLVVDNRDSFTMNLAHDLMALGADVLVRPAADPVPDMWTVAPDAVLVGPGPGTPDTSGCTLEITRTCLALDVPLLGVCLGHQALGQVCGGRVVRHQPVHGRPSVVDHDGTGLFEGIPGGAEFGRYHSLVVDGLAADHVVATSGDIVVAMRVPGRRAWGVQFHPESLLSPHGRVLLSRWLEMSQ